MVELGEQLHRLLVELDAGRLDATPAGRARIEGAVIAVEVILGRDPGPLVERLRSTP